MEAAGIHGGGEQGPRSELRSGSSPPIGSTGKVTVPCAPRYPMHYTISMSVTSTARHPSEFGPCALGPVRRPPPSAPEAWREGWHRPPAIGQKTARERRNWSAAVS